MPPLRFLFPALLLGTLAINAWAQMVRDLLGLDTNPPTLTALQGLCGALAAGAAVAAWRRHASAPVLTILYGVVTAAMISALPSLLALDADQARGIRTGAIVVVVAMFLVAAALRRALRSLTAGPS